MADLLVKREKGAIDAASLRSQIAVFKSQRIKTCGHLLKLYEAKNVQPKPTRATHTHTHARSHAHILHIHKCTLSNASDIGGKSTGCSCR